MLLTTFKRVVSVLWDMRKLEFIMNIFNCKITVHLQIYNLTQEREVGDWPIVTKCIWVQVFLFRIGLTSAVPVWNGQLLGSQYCCLQLGRGSACSEHVAVACPFVAGAVQNKPVWNEPIAWPQEMLIQNNFTLDRLP